MPGIEIYLNSLQPLESMILGRIIGKVSTTSFMFKVDDISNAKKFDFVQIMHSACGYVLCQILEVEKDKDSTIAYCNIIGYKDKDNILRQPRTPFEPGAEVLIADDNLIHEIIRLDSSDTAFIGTLEGKENIRINLDMNKLLTKHVAILAKTGAGKSYVAGVLAEEIIEKKIPLLIIDPHGEYSQIKTKNDSTDEIKKLDALGLKAKGYASCVQEYGDLDLGPNVKPLLLNEEMTPRELLTILPAKTTMTQQATIYSVMKDLKTVTLSQIASNLEILDIGKQSNLLSMIDYLKSLNIFSLNFTQYTEIVKPGRCSIINLKGIEPEIQDIIVYKLLKDLFEMRKVNKVSPFFCLIEEAHNFVPEKGLGERKAASVIRTIASEGRKFGLGLCIITQRPARVEKNVVSQCNTNIILKVTNANDLKAIGSSVEGITSEGEKEIQNLPIGVAIITGIADMPFFVKIRPRKSKHGGNAVNIFQSAEKNLVDEAKKFLHNEMLPVIDSKYSIKEIKIMEENKKKIETYLIPAVRFAIKSEPEYFILVDRMKGNIITDIAKKELIAMKDVKKLETYQTYEKIEFKKTQYDKKLEPKLKIEDVKKKLGIMADITSYDECYVVYHYAK